MLTRKARSIYGIDCKSGFVCRGFSEGIITLMSDGFSEGINTLMMMASAKASLP
jgi:hypothetical protein